MSSRTLHVPTAIGAALVAASLANVAQFGALELETSDQYEAVRLKGGHDVASLVDGHFESTRERFAVYAALREHAPGAVVGLPDGVSLRGEQLLGLGRASEVRLLGPAAPLTPEELARLEAAVVVEGTDELLGDFAVAVAAGPVGAVTIVRSPQLTYVADVRLLSTDPVGP